MPSTQELIERGRQALERFQPVLAALSLRESLALEPESAEANAQMGRLLAAAGETEQAQALLDRALATRPDHALALTGKAAILNMRGKFAEAVPLLQRALESDPRLEAAQVNLGHALREQGSLKDAESSFRAAVQLNPRSVEAHYGLGQVLSLEGKHAEALAEARECLTIDPGFLAGYLVESALCAALGKPDEALEALQRALRHNPGAVVVRERRRDLFLARRDFIAAHGEGEQIAAMRGSPDDWMQLGNLALLAGNPNRAAAAFQKAAELAPEAWEPHYNLGDLYDAGNLRVQAGNEYTLALERGQNSYAPHNGMGLWLLKEGRVEEAIAQLSRAAELAPGSAAAQYNLALAYVKGNQRSLAKERLDRILQDPGLGQEAARLLSALKSDGGN